MRKTDKGTCTEHYSLQTILLLFVIGGLFGFIYEELFYRIDLGYWTKRGITFGPWIPIYGFGAVIIILLIKRIKDKPWLVFLSAVVVSGVIEFVAGYILFQAFHIRLWDYNAEIWNWMNIDGYVCFRSVAFFGVSAIFFQYLVLPLLIKFTEKCPRKYMNLITGVLASLFIGDIVLSLICKAFT
ncbi:MAG: putative ABC transporter permease [bacterium]|nr:putative ABC transporter permease [bacterium]